MANARPFGAGGGNSASYIRSPELRVNVDRARSADLGMPIDSLATKLRTLVGGEEVSKFKDGDDQYSVFLRLDLVRIGPPVD